MFSRQKLVASLIAVPALVGGLLVSSAATPAEAAGHAGVQLLSASVAVGKPSSSGNRAGKVKLGCSFRTKDCVGTMRFLPASGTSGGGYFSYRVKPRSTAYATIYYWHDQPAVTTVANRIHKKIQFNQTKTTAADYTKWIYVEPQIRVRLSGTVTGPDLNDTGKIKNVEVELHDWNGRISREVKAVPVNQSNGAYDLGTFSLGLNNAPIATRRLSISAMVKDFGSGDWKFHQWFWRGSTAGSGAAHGGTKYIEDSNGAKLTKYNETGFKANFTFGKIVGQANNPTGPDGGADIRISAPPRTMPRGSDLRALDIPYCANDFANTTTTAAGQFQQTFLPTAGTSDPRYLVKVSSNEKSTGMRLWNNAYGSCLHARNYQNSNANLIALPVSTLTLPTSNIRSSVASLKGDLNFSGFSPKLSDYRLTLREYLPYKKVLDSPIVGSTKAASNGNYTFDNVLPGTYWLESGRRTSCSAWYASLYPNNNLYLQGADRGAERWKTVSGRVAEYQKSYTMGYVKRTPPSGYKGWMYRGFCEQRGKGVILKTTVSGGQAFGTSPAHAPNNATIGEGAVVSGHISRIGGKSNKEMLISIYSTQGTLVMRTAYSGKSGNFKVRGLASGNYNIELNADSWRGIGRSFTGRHTIRVTAGHSYGVGTLKAKF